MERREAKERGTNSILLRKLPKSCSHSEQAALGVYLDKGTVNRSLPPGSMQQELDRKPYISEDALVTAQSSSRCTSVKALQ